MARIASLDQSIEAALGVLPVALNPLSGGCVGQVYRAMLPAGNPPLLSPDQQTAVVIKADPSPGAKLGVEGFMLRYLREHSALPVPDVLHSDDHLLVMTWLPGNSRFSGKAQEHAAELLAALHQVRAEQFGLERETLIGGLPQPNPWRSSWLEFFREDRILWMAREGHREGAVPDAMLRRLERFCDRLETWLTEPDHPALLHGDAWTTNLLAEGDRITGFLDPAIYYGHPEIELAFTTLFGTFGEAFFKRYNEISPLEAGFFDLRRDLYNLYPLLVHVRLFGAGYLADVDRILKRIGL